MVDRFTAKIAQFHEWNVAGKIRGDAYALNRDVVLAPFDRARFLLAFPEEIETLKVGDGNANHFVE